MPFIEVQSYAVGTSRGGDSPHYTRTLVLNAKNPSTAPVTVVYLYFFVPGTTFAETTIGNQPGTFARAYVPIADFDVCYKLVQTERPVYFHWSMDGTRMRGYALGTNIEPPGEGTTDHS